MVQREAVVRCWTHFRGKECAASEFLQAHADHKGQEKQQDGEEEDVGVIHRRGTAGTGDETTCSHAFLLGAFVQVQAVEEIIYDNTVVQWRLIVTDICEHAGAGIIEKNSRSIVDRIGFANLQNLSNGIIDEDRRH